MPKGIWKNRERKSLSKEHKEKIRQSHLGEKNHFWGKTHTSKVCNKLSEYAKKRKGKLSPAWRGGIYPLKSLIRKCFKYRQWRSDVYSRDDFTCQRCNQHGGKLIVDHIKAFSLILYENNIKTMEEAEDCEELWNINNGRVLCQQCHIKTENYAGKNKKFKPLKKR